MFERIEGTTEATRAGAREQDWNAWELTGRSSNAHACVSVGSENMELERRRRRFPLAVFSASAYTEHLTAGDRCCIHGQVRTWLSLRTDAAKMRRLRRTPMTNPLRRFPGCRSARDWQTCRHARGRS